MPAFGTIIWLLGAVVLFRMIWKTGLAMLRSMATPPPPPDFEPVPSTLEDADDPALKVDEKSRFYMR